VKGVPSIVRLIALNLLLAALALALALHAAADDHPTSWHRILAWIAVGALPILLLALIALLVRAIRVADFFGVVERGP
jgi:hypothetical protein